MITRPNMCYQRSIITILLRTMLTSHAFIDKYPIDPSSEKLILGTIHPANPGRFPLQFFYGSAGTLWKILSDAFPGELNQPITVEGIRQFLERRSISMSDTVRTCKRKRDTAFDEDIIPVELNHSLVDQVKQKSLSLFRNRLFNV